MNTYLKALTAVCGVVVATAVALFASPGEAVVNTQAINATQGIVAILDKDTGELRAPTAEEARRYQSPAKSSASPLPVERRADGSESMKLDDRYTTYSTVTRRADGGWTRRCSLDHDHTQHALKAVL